MEVSTDCCLRPHTGVTMPVMSVRIFYIDESYDDRKFCLSAIAIRHTEWKECFNLVREHRKQLKRDYGIFLRKEIHATDFIAGRGRISDKEIGKWQRSRLFLGLLQLVARFPKALCFNVCSDGRTVVELLVVSWQTMHYGIKFSNTHDDSLLQVRQGVRCGFY